jgi:hypothetical protein
MGGPESAFFVGLKGAFENTDQSNVRRERLLFEYWDKELLRERMYQFWLDTFLPFVSKESGNVFVEKSPAHALHMSTIKSLLPQAKFVHIIRDSRSVVASTLASAKTWGKYWAPRKAKNASLMWCLHVRTARKDGKILGENDYMEVYYEDLRLYTIRELGKIFDFIGIRYSLDTVQKIIDEQEFSRQRAMGGTRFTIGQRKPEPEGFFRKGQVDSWKTDLTFVEKLIVWRFTRRLMSECGYCWRGR